MHSWNFKLLVVLTFYLPLFSYGRPETSNYLNFKSKPTFILDYLNLKMTAFSFIQHCLIKDSVQLSRSLQSGCFSLCHSGIWFLNYFGTNVSFVHDVSIFSTEEGDSILLRNLYIDPTALRAYHNKCGPSPNNSFRHWLSLSKHDMSLC
jgi:hypothetical protein